MRNRLLSVDFMRGIAVVAMIEIHVWGAFIANPVTPAGQAMGKMSAILGGNAAELFAMVAGVSASLLVNTYRSRGQAESSIRQFLLTRGAFLFLLSTTINIIAGAVFNLHDISVLNWSVIQLIGACLILAPAFSRSSWPLRVLWILGPWMLVALVYPRWPHLAPLFTGVAPIFPWSSLFFAGMWIGDLFSARSSGHTEPSSLIVMGGIGLLIALPVTYLLSQLLAQAPAWIHGNDVHFTTFTMLVGIFVVLFALSNYFLDQRAGSVGFTRKGATVLAEIGQRSLTIYYIQLLVVVIGGMLVHRYLGDARKLHWMWFLPIVVFTLVSIYWIVNVIWKRYDYFLSIEWFMARLVKKPSSKLSSVPIIVEEVLETRDPRASES